MVDVNSLIGVTLAVVIGTLAAIVYSLRILVLLERRIARIDKHIELMSLTIVKDENKELKEESRIESMLGKRSARTAKVKKKRR